MRFSSTVTCDTVTYLHRRVQPERMQLDMGIFILMDSFPD
jgi:hypothetical protein